MEDINQSLSTEDSDKLNKFISSIEIEEAIKGMKNEKVLEMMGFLKNFIISSSIYLRTN